MLHIQVSKRVSLIKDYHLLMKRRFACPNVSESYAGGDISFCQTCHRVVARRNVVPGLPGWGLNVGLTTPPW
jgi:hypothetical protein